MDASTSRINAQKAKHVTRGFLALAAAADSLEQARVAFECAESGQFPEPTEDAFKLEIPVSPQHEIWAHAPRYEND